MTEPVLDVRTVFLPWQECVLRSEEKHVIAVCGVGSGKTNIGALWHFEQLIGLPGGVKTLVAANTYPQLFDSTLTPYLEMLAAWQVPHYPQTLPGYGPFDLMIWNGERWVQNYCRSLNDPKNISGIETGVFWQDEVSFSSEEAKNIVRARNRAPQMRWMGKPSRGLYTTTADDPSSWLHKMAVQDHAPDDWHEGDLYRWSRKLNQRNSDGIMTNGQLVVTAETGANFLLPADYIDDLMATYSGPLADRMIKALWVTLTTGLVYYEFGDHNISVKAEFNPHLPIYWSWDFNIGDGKPMSTCLGHLVRGKAPNGKGRTEAHIFDEIVIDSVSTPKMIEEFRSKGQVKGGIPWIEKSRVGAKGDLGRVVRVRGDYSGHSRQTSGHTDYGIMRSDGFTNQTVRPNPLLRDQHNCVNSNLRSANGDVRILIHPRCKNIIHGMQTTKLKPGASYVEVEARPQHVCKAVTYWMCIDLPLLAKAATARSLY